MFDTHNRGEEISANTYATVMRHQFHLESLGNRLQKIEDATTIMKEKWRRGDGAMRDFTGGIVRDLEVQIGNALVPVDFHVLDIKLNCNSSLLLGRAFLSIVGAVCNLQTNQLCLTLIDHHVHHNPIPAEKPQTTSRRINDPGIIAACHSSTDIAYHPSIDTNVDATRDGDYSIGSWEDDRHHESYAVGTVYRDQRADELHEGFTYAELLNIQRRNETDQKRAEAAWERTHFSHPIDRTSRPLIFINPSTSIDMDHTISIDIRPIPKSTVSEKAKPVSNSRLIWYFHGPRWLRKSNRWTYTSRISRGYYRHPSDSQWSRQPLHATTNIPEDQEKVTKEFYDTAGGIDSRFKQKSRHPTRPSIDVDVPTSVDRRPEFGRRAFDLFCTRKFYWEEKNEYGIYKDDQRFARDVDGHTIRVQNKDIRRLLERASRDGPNYIFLSEHASPFTQTKLVPEIYTKDKINEKFYGVCGEQEKNKEDFQMKLDRVYYPLKDSISWLTTCMEEMRQDIARIQHATDVSRPTSIDRCRKASIDSHLPASIDNRLQASVDDNPPHSHTMKSQPDFHTREEIDQLVGGIYRALKNYIREA
ncbi:hypothetical protein DY000_02022995 [Brassica cretica]|uniref:Uncharacterized protein n=1 Tax=Brassica cretica TaxID=69181 RepID=A0ABQ7EH16_BRACR|nr:hypothetical protein DY000_02022995 [Brassica cretica]